jgi:predicted membrane metal-binding protein
MMMGLAYLLSLVLGREKDVWSTLAIAALLVLGLDPHALFSIFSSALIPCSGRNPVAVPDDLKPACIGR